MATLDVSDVLSSPEFTDTTGVTITQTTRVIGANGVGTDTAVVAPIFPVPVVTPDRSTMRRQQDGTFLEAAIDVYAMMYMTAGFKIDDATSRLADIITWHGDQYVVMSVNDWGAFGAGWFQASAQLVTVNPVD